MQEPMRLTIADPWLHGRVFSAEDIRRLSGAMDLGRTEPAPSLPVPALPQLLDRARMVTAVAPVLTILKESFPPLSWEWLKTDRSDVVANLASAEAELGRACDSADHTQFAYALHRCCDLYSKALALCAKQGPSERFKSAANG